MDVLAQPLLIYYILVVAVFCVYGVHRYWLVWTFFRSGGLAGRRPEDGAESAAEFRDLPRVTVQLPMFNERHVAERVIEAACGLDYPADRLQIQVLDDSTDDSAEIARRCCERMREAGHDIQHIHRADRTGFKAGALAAGMADVTGEYIALFDADFVPTPDLLRRCIHHFTDESVGMVQMRWEHLNRDESLLTQIQALCLDGHFVIEQTARDRSGRWFNFNGTAGIWRRRCIDEAGGWQHDTLTEDTDLSYRAQLAGWRFKYLPQITCPAELPPTVGALMTQQHRWNKGLIQTAIKLIPTIVRSRAPLGTKIEACFHLTSSLPYAAILLLTLMTAPAFAIGLPDTGISPWLANGLGLVCLGLGTLAACVFYVASQVAQGRGIIGATVRIPALMAVGVGVSLLNTRAVVEAIMGRRSPFVRTPKFAGAESSDPDPILSRRRRFPPGTSELALAGVMIVSMILCFTQPFTLVGGVFIALFGAGYLAIGLPQVLGALRQGRGEASRAALRAIAASGTSLE